MAYVTLEELKEYIGINNVDDTVDDSVLEICLSSAESAIDKYCSRTFNKDASVSTRKYRVFNSPYCILTDDIATATGFVLALDENEDGIAETTVSSSAYQLEPFQTNSKPYTSVRLVNGDRFPVSRYGMYLIHITAYWGWPSVPAEVKTATLILATRYFKRKNSPEGVLVNAEWGVARVARMDPDVGNLLSPYRIHLQRTF